MDHLRAFFEKLAENRDLSQPLNRDLVIDHLLSPYGRILEKCKSILDVGTGTGSLIPILRNRMPISQITSIDLAFNMLLRAQQKTPGASLIQSDVHSLPFPNRYFTFVICHNSFAHFWQKDKSLREIQRVLEPAGYLLILHDLSRAKVNTIHQNAQAQIIHHDLLPEGNTLRQMFERTGFQTFRNTQTGRPCYCPCSFGSKRHCAPLRRIHKTASTKEILEQHYVSGFFRSIDKRRTFPSRKKIWPLMLLSNTCPSICCRLPSTK